MRCDRGSDHRAVAREARTFFGVGCDLPDDDDFCEQYIVVDDYGNCDGDEEAATVCGIALLQSGTGDEARGSGADDCDGAGRVRGDGRVRRETRQNARARAGQYGIHREPAAGAVSPGCDSRAGGRSRFHRRHRQFDEAGLRAPDGTADAAGFCGTGYDVLYFADHV